MGSAATQVQPVPVVGKATVAEPLLSQAREGTCLLLSTKDAGQTLLPGTLAVRALLHSLGTSPNSHHRMIVLSGHGETRGTQAVDRQRTAGHSGNDFQGFSLGEHERGWVEAGKLYERLLGMEVPRPADVTHVFCLDPWAAGAESTARALFPAAKWVYVWDIDHRHHTDDSSYWDQYAAWIKSRRFDHVVHASALFSYLPVDFWEPGDAQPLRKAIQDGCETGLTFIIDESGGFPPTSGVLQSAHRQLGSDSRVILISPHLPYYLAKHAALVQRCAAALDPANLTAPVYAALLRCADIYVSPKRLPFGFGPLKALRDKAEVHLDRRDETELPDERHYQVYWHEEKEAEAARSTEEGTRERVVAEGPPAGDTAAIEERPSP